MKEKQSVAAEMKSRKVDIYMTYSYENGNKENPKYVYEPHGERQDIRTLTEGLIGLVYPETQFALLEVGEETKDSSVVHGQLIFNGNEKRNDFNLTYRTEGEKVIIDKFEVRDL